MTKTIEDIKKQAEQLIQDAKEAGIVVTIGLRPLQPFAMGHHEMVAEVLPKQEY